MTPMTAKEIEFESTNADQESVTNAIKNYYDTTGISNVLFSGSDTTGGLEYSTMTDEMVLTGSGGLYRQLERWLNRYFKNRFDFKVTVQLLDVTSFNIAKKKEEYLKSAQYGNPCKSQISALSGTSQNEMLSLSILENDVLKLDEKWIPLSSSHTTSSKANNNTTRSNDNEEVL